MHTPRRLSRRAIFALSYFHSHFLFSLAFAALATVRLNRRLNSCWLFGSKTSAVFIAVSWRFIAAAARPDKLLADTNCISKSYNTYLKASDT